MRIESANRNALITHVQAVRDSAVYGGQTVLYRECETQCTQYTHTESVRLNAHSMHIDNALDIHIQKVQDSKHTPRTMIMHSMYTYRKCCI